MNYVFHPAALQELQEAILFYEGRRLGLGRRFRSAMDAGLNEICEQPNRFPVEALPNIKRHRVRRFPYWIFFREKQDSIQVLAIAHHRQRPQYWIKRQ